MTINEVRKRIEDAVAPIEGRPEQYICPRLDARCPYFGGDKQCPDSGCGNCQLAQKWFDRWR